MIKIYDALIFVGQSLSNAICSLEHYLLKHVKHRVSGHVSELYNEVSAACLKSLKNLVKDGYSGEIFFTKFIS